MSVRATFSLNLAGAPVEVDWTMEQIGDHLSDRGLILEEDWFVASRASLEVKTLEAAREALDLIASGTVEDLYMVETDREASG